MRYRTDCENEYFPIENRANNGLDTYLPASGLAVFHCDTLGSNAFEDGTPDRHYQCALLQADGHQDLETDYNTGDAGDLFDNRMGKALDYSTAPSSKLWDGSDSGFVLYDVGAAGDIIPVTVGDRPQATK